MKILGPPLMPWERLMPKAPLFISYFACSRHHCFNSARDIGRIPLFQIDIHWALMFQLWLLSVISRFVFSVLRDSKSLVRFWLLATECPYCFAFINYNFTTLHAILFDSPHMLPKWPSAVSWIFIIINSLGYGYDKDWLQLVLIIFVKLFSNKIC